MKYSLVIILFVLSIICCNPIMVIKSPLPSRELALCLNVTAPIPEELLHELDSVTNAFIDNYNATNSRFKLIQCQNDDQRTLYLDIIQINITNPEIQAAGIVLTTLGVATPIVMIALNAPFYITFAYLPRSTIMMNMRPSADLVDFELIGKVQKYGASSGRYFGSYEKQKNLLLCNYYKRLEKVINSIQTGSTQ